MKISITKTAEIKTIGTLSVNTKKILIVTHGHGQLTKYFSKKLEWIQHPDLYIICPEALNRFYLKGFNGRVGSTWMTSEFRDDDIKDNHNYLNTVLKNCLNIANDPEIHLLGFSQGAQTISRWALFEQINYSSICLWGGRQAHDVKWINYAKASLQIPFELRMGDDDEYYSEGKISNWLSDWKENNTSYNFQLYKGKHRLEKQAILDYKKQILKL